MYLENGEVFISKSLADEFKLNVGDKLSIFCGQEARELVISKIFTTSILNGVYVCDDFGFDDQYKVFGMWIECSDVTAEKIDYINTINGTNTATTMKQYVDNFSEKTSSISTMTTTIKIFAISLVIVVLFNFILLILKERIRELATLKVLGKTNYTIVLTLFFEILFMIIIGTVVGYFLGKPLLILVLSINKVEGLNFIYKISFSSYLLSFVLIFVTLIVVMALCYRKIRNINMIESLKTME